MSDDVTTLVGAASRAAAEGRPVEASLLGWAALVTDAADSLRAVIVDQSGRPPSDFFAVLEQAMPGSMPSPVPGETAQDWLLRCRDDLIALVPPSLVEDLHGMLMTSLDLRGIPAPDGDDLSSYALDRTGGLAPKQFAEAKRLDALEHMEIAQSLRVKADVGGAIREAYAADLASTEAYLVESAAAAGDTLLMTVISRWTLISDAISRMSGLPADFTIAVASVRAAILGALNEADALRLRSQLAPV